MRRRHFLARGGVGAAALLAPGVLRGGAPPFDDLADAAGADPRALARDEAFWRRFRAGYALPRGEVNLDNAAGAPTSRRVSEAYARWARETPAFSTADRARAGEAWDAGFAPVLQAQALGDDAEWLLVRNATEALVMVILGVPLQRGDEVVVTSHEYETIVDAVEMRVRREGIVRRTARLPEPGTETPEGIVAAVERELTPRTRLLLVSQLSAWSGLVLPVAEIARVARARGVEVLVDGAQSFGLLDTGMRTLGCDYFGTSLHKWLGAPLGTGMLCLRKARIAALWPLFPDARDGWESFTKLTRPGTVPDAAYFAVADAARAHTAVGAERLAARLALLTRRWVDAVRAEPRVRLRTPMTEGLWAGFATVAVDGIPSADLARRLAERGFVVQNKGKRGSPFASGVRVSPHGYTSPDEIDRFADALRRLARG